MSHIVGLSGVVSDRLNKYKANINPTEMAEMLRDLAYQVEQGTVTVSAISRSESVGFGEYATSMLNIKYYPSYPDESQIGEMRSEPEDDGDEEEVDTE